MRNFNKAADNNKGPILDVIRSVFSEPGTVLEIGSGSGQHALHFATELEHLQWQTSDREPYLTPLAENVREFMPANVLAPLLLDVSGSWPANRYEYVFAANVLHIMAAELIEPFFAGVSNCLHAEGVCCIYGPFRYHGQFTTESNAQFNEWLKARNPESGIRDVEIVIAVAQKHGLQLEADHAMPANNQLLIFRRAS